MPNVSDLVLSRYSDINPRFGVKSGDILDQGVEAINSSIENILGTGFGERVFLPQFGSRIKSLLFENVNDSTAQEIFNVLTDAIKDWEPRISISFEESYIVPDIDNNSYQISLVYKILEIDLQGEFQANISSI